MKILKATIVTRKNATDIVYLETNIDASQFTFLYNSSKLNVTFETPSGEACDYVKKTFGVEPEMING